MNIKFRRKTALLVGMALFLSVISGFSSIGKSAAMISVNPTNGNRSINTVDVNKSSEAGNSALSNIVATSDSKNNSVDSSSQDNQQNQLLASMMNLAKQGKIINSEFVVKSTVIDAVEKKLGKPDKVDWILAAKGNYATFSKYNVVFGFNKGSQIFEARSFDSRLSKVSMSMVKRAYGTPAYHVKANGEEIIGYTAGQEYKVLLVFPEPQKNSSDPLLKHYSVLYPKGTVNMMADDPGRQW